jgi:hypothetical protein
MEHLLRIMDGRSVCRFSFARTELGPRHRRSTLENTVHPVELRVCGEEFVGINGSAAR